jgi:hypothetical protein
MVSRARLGMLALALMATSALTPVLMAPAGAVAGSSIAVHGRILVAQPDALGRQPRYAVALADGDIVPIRGDFDPGARTGAVFDGRLALPATVTRTLSDHGESGATAALRVVDRRVLTLAVVGSPTITEVSAAVTPTTHAQFVAAIDNRGSLGQSDSQLLGHVSTVGAYWKGEADGAISSIGVPSTVTHYDTDLSTTDCGLGNDFFALVQEAAARFPGIQIGGTDQLVLFVPPSCSSGGIVGEGTVGSSFASGGALIVKAGAAIEGIYAHETGHNYGFEHADVRWSGTLLEYFGIYDVMGFALSGVNQLTALSTPFRVFQGIVQPGEIQNVDLGTRTVPVHAIAAIKPRSDDTGTRSVRVVDPDTGRTLYLDYRSGTDQDAGSAYLAKWGLSSSKGVVHYAPGVVITATRPGGGADTMVVDDTGDTSLAAGDTWRNASRTLTVHVTGIDAAGAHVTIDYTLGKLATAKPKISGKPHVGRTLKARHGAWTAGTTFSYTWHANGKRIKRATAATLRLTRAQKGKRVSVTVTGKKPGYTTVSRTSARTRKIH